MTKNTSSRYNLVSQQENINEKDKKTLCIEQAKQELFANLEVESFQKKFVNRNHLAMKISDMRNSN
jgi:hypothetical protein